MSAQWKLAASATYAHRVTFAGTALVLAAAGGVIATVGVLMETGVRAGDAGFDLTALASSYAGTALVVVLFVVAATVSLALRGRHRELALVRTIGATRGQVRGQVAREVLLVALVAVPVGALLGLASATLLRPILVDAGMVRPGSGLAWSPLPVAVALGLVLPVALLAGRLATRETLRMEPLDAVRTSAVEPPSIGTVRRGLAIACAVAGVATAGSPLVVPGTIGSASAAMSAFLLVGAAALAGPSLVTWAFGRTSRMPGRRRGAPTVLALHNVRGFSRRLTGVVVPLAVALAIGTVQTSVDHAVARAAEVQIRAALGSDLVVTGTGGDDQLAQVADVPGVATAVPLSVVPVEVRTDEEDMPDRLVWERTALRTVPADVPRTMVDPGVTHGSLAALADPGTVAISTDAAFATGIGTGDTVDLRYDTTEHQVRVVAVFDRGLGLGDYLVTPQTAAGFGARPSADTVLVGTTDPASVTSRLRASGLTVETAEQYAATSTDPDAAAQHLSSVLVLLLLVFVGLGAANALVLTTAGRRAEFRLLHRTGTTRRQLLSVLTVESLLTGVLAWLIGTVAVLPAVLGVSVGLLGWSIPVVDTQTYLVLSGAVMVTAVGATLLTAARTIPRRIG
ncbi:FtsX-like permease family protein [Cellulomonas sp. URHE0023]|uniref:FtsX-like permease family protein n=1 Tax=Cellulomonas sp. URHE0023 TaxID=1380354 RepID=UPI0004817A16|nr:ABC transporter permease [Cellulomonas sp. URHE0023]